MIGSAGARRLGSARRPVTEAGRYAASVDVRAGAVLAVTGFGLGHHLAALSSRIGRHGMLAVFEPDVALLRAVLERVDCTGWLTTTPTVIVTDPEDTATLGAALTNYQALAAMGVKLVDDHPPSLARIGSESSALFGRSVTRVVKAVRTTITTTLLQVETTLSNCLMNLDRYATVPGIADLADAHAGRPAVLVAAGPSLARNIDVLARPGIRDRVVIIAAQTVLRALLARGIRPHYVTALDYHEISTRFYEGLTPKDVQGVTLIAQPMCNPAILDAFPGSIRLTSDERLDTLLGVEHARPMGTLPGAATVAHLSYFLGRHLGCDPAILVGQDLGFTDGQYYAAGAAIHSVWACELNPFRTLEMLEHERIVRSRAQLVPTSDHQGRRIYTDEQMHSYLVQFEEMFQADQARGLRTIDATEGGVRKHATSSMPLAEAIDSFAPEGAGEVGTMGKTDRAHTRSPDAPGRRVAIERLGVARKRATRVARCCDRTLGVLDRMKQASGDTAKVNALIARTERIRDEVRALEPAYRLTQFLNQVGTLRRLRADRDIALDTELSAVQRQGRQIERDIANVRWLGDAARQLGAMLGEAIEAIETGRKVTRRTPALASVSDDPQLRGSVGSDRRAQLASSRTERSKLRVVAVVPVDPDRSGLGTARDLGATIARKTHALGLTLDRLARCRSIERIVIVTRDPDRVRGLVGDRNEHPRGVPVQVLAEPEPQGPVQPDPVRKMIRSARVFAPTSWRGAIGGLTVYDELFDPGRFSDALAAVGADAGALVGPDWVLVDPALVDDLVTRHAEDPDGRPMTFSQAPPGLGACVVSRKMAEDLRAQIGSGGHLASIGGVLGYHPSSPRPDPLVRSACVGVPDSVRDLMRRVVADTPARARSLGGLIETLGEDWSAATGDVLASSLASLDDEQEAAVPGHVVLELCTGRLTSGVRAGWSRIDADAPERGPVPTERAIRLIEELASHRPDLALTIAGEGDPLHHPEWSRIIGCARDAWVGAIHLRTDLLCAGAEPERLAESGVDVVSVDLLADSRDSYRALAGVDRFEHATGNLDRLIAAVRASTDGPRPVWIVPRITRCDAVYDEIEAFYDRWLSRTGACVIDPMPLPRVGDRIAPLPVPEAAMRREDGSTLRVDADGGVRAPGIDTPWRTIGDEPIGVIWRRLRRVRLAAGVIENTESQHRERTAVEPAPWDHAGMRVA